MRRGIYIVYIPELKLLFVHIPKTGGQSVTKYLYECLGVGDQFNKNRGSHDTIKSLLSSDVPDDKYIFTKNISQKLPGPYILTHMTLNEYFKFKYITEDMNNVIKFSTVRNPYDRVISAFGQTQFTSKQLTLKSLKAYALSKNKNEGNVRHLMKQSDYVVINGKVALDYVIKTENLDTELKPFILDKFNLSSDKFKKMNAVKTKKHNLKPDIIKFINDHYHDDFVNFNYTKRNPHD